MGVKIYWTQHAIKGFNDHAMHHLRPIAMEFIDTYIEIDEKSHVMNDGLVSAFHVYICAQGFEFNGTFEALEHCVEHWLKEFVPGIRRRGMFVSPGKFVGAYIGISLKSFPNP